MSNWKRETVTGINNQTKFKPRPGGFGKVTARRESITSFNKQTKVRPITPDSLLSEEDIKLTKEQHPCTQNLGMATAFLMPIAMIAAAVGAGTYYWFDVEGDNVGLFQSCNNWTKECVSMSKKYVGDSMMKTVWTAGVPLELTGIALCFAGTIALLCYPCHRKLNFSKITCAAIIAIILLLGTLLHGAGVSMFIYFYFGKNQEYSIQWSFFAGVGSAVVVLVSCILFWVHVFYTGCFDT